MRFALLPIGQNLISPLFIAVLLGVQGLGRHDKALMPDGFAIAQSMAVVTKTRAVDIFLCHQSHFQAQ